MQRLAATALILVALSRGGTAQTTITGRVIVDATGDPVVNARVTLASTAVGTPVVLTNAEGRFSLPAPPTRSAIIVTKTGYGRVEGTPASDDRPIEIRLKGAAAISGQVIDEFGDPVVGFAVAIGLASDTGPTLPFASTFTDDRGEYRIPVGAGSYTVRVTVQRQPTQPTRLPDGRTPFFGPVAVNVYYPGVEDKSRADHLRLEPGDDRSRIDFVVPAQHRFLTPQLLAGTEAARATADAIGTVRGRVSATDGRPIARAEVLLSDESAAVQQQTTADDEGRYQFRDVAAGSVRLFAFKSGFSATTPATPVTLTLPAGAARENVDLTLARWGTLSGRVLDELGDPIQGVSVQLMQTQYEAGRRRLVLPGPTPRVTDDLGRYRLFGFPPGQYIVSATGAVVAADIPGYARSYYPGTTNASSAQFVSVGVSQDVGGIDFTMSRGQTARASGKVLNAAGQQGVSGSLQMFPARDSGGVASASVGARIMPDGTFEFPSVPSGPYVIQAYRGKTNRSTEGEFGTLRVSLVSDVSDLVLQTSTGSSIAGRFIFDASDRTKAPDRTAIELTSVPTDYDLSPSGNLAIADIRDDWTFEMAGLNGPRRLQLRRLPSGWMLKEVRARGIEITDRVLPLGRAEQSLSDVEIVLTDGITQVAGAIQDGRGKGVAGAVVVVFATDRERWYEKSRYLQTATTQPDGAFTIAGLPFGSYYAAALTEMPAGGGDAWQDPDVLASLIPRASSFTVGLGQTPALSLRLPSR